MFAEPIRSTPFSTQEANAALPNISGESFSGMDDVSFLSTLRALLGARLQDGQAVSLKFRSCAITDDIRSAHPPRAIIEALILTPSAPDRITVCNLNAGEEENGAALEMLQETIPCYPGWQLLQKVTDFYRRSFRAQCYINPELRSVLVVVEALNLRKLHYLQCSIVAFLPWYFDPSKGLSEDEMALVNSLREKQPDNYLACLERMAEAYDFRSARIRQALSGFESRIEQKLLESTRAEIESYARKIDDLKERLGSVVREKAEKDALLLGLENKMAQGGEGSELMQYFMSNRNLYILSSSDSVVKFACKGFLTYFNEDEARSMIREPRSILYRPDGVSREERIPSRDMRLLMTAVFLDQTVKLRLCAAYEMNINGRTKASSACNFGPAFADSLPNAHIQRYACLGNHETVLAELMAARNYIGAVEQCMASCMSLNFGDSVVMKEFMCYIYGLSGSYTGHRCFVLPDGTETTAKGAIEWLKAQENKEE